MTAWTLVTMVQTEGIGYFWKRRVYADNEDETKVRKLGVRETVTFDRAASLVSNTESMLWPL